MKDIFKIVKKILFLAVIVFSSCTAHNKISCPSFDTKNSVSKSRIVFNNFKKVFSFKNRNKSKPKALLQPQFISQQFSDSNRVELDLFASNETLFALEFLNIPDSYADNQNKNNRIFKKENNFKKYNAKKMQTFNKSSKKNNSVSFENKKLTFDSNKKERKNAIIIGGALLLMALLSGIVFPSLGTLTASLGLIGIFILDVLVSFGIYKYHKKERPNLSKFSSTLRLMYTAIFGVGIGFHIMDNVSMFNKIWGIGLIIFGIHLITLGILFNNEGGKKWINIAIKLLLILAGIGYMIQYVGILLVANPVAFAAIIQSIFIVPMILGEILYALWMLIKGGKLKKQEN